jgi:hypothetical protein
LIKYLSTYPYNETYNGVIPAKAGIQLLVFENGGICLVGFGYLLDAGSSPA